MLRHYKSKKIIAGCDEAGRGCLAGPVFAATVVLPKNYKNKDLDDSKKVKTHQQRAILRKDIEANALYYAVAKSSPREIDKINILNASFLTMHKAVEKLEIVPDLLLIDGNRFNPYKQIQYETIIKGDGIYYSIAAASILAKTYRDDYMTRLAKKFPLYHWNTNMGYPTIAHRQAIIDHGPCTHHRKSFRLYPLPEQLKLFNVKK
jgi:ribonuclease HII